MMRETRRQFTRLKTVEQAKLSFLNGETIACEIFDFSQKGLKLRALDPKSADPIIVHHVPDESAIIRIQGEKRCALQGRLIHASRAGLGFDLSQDLPADVFRSLINARARLPFKNGEREGLLPEENHAILRDCVGLFRDFISQAWQSLFTDVGLKLAKRDTAHLYLTDHSRYLNALADLQLRIDEISRRHYDMLIDRMHKIGELKEAASPNSVDELAIVDEDSLEDWLNISGVFTRLETDNHAAMYQFGRRFSRLTPVLIGPHNDPFGPQAVCLTFQESLHDLDFNNAMRAILYRRFGEILASGYPDLYENLNRLLAPLKPVDLNGPKTDDKPADDDAQAGGSHTDSQPDPGKVEEQISRLVQIAESLFALQQPMTAGDAAALREIVTSPTPKAGVAPGDPKLFQLLLDLSTERLPSRQASVPDVQSRPTKPTQPAITADQLNQLQSWLSSAQLDLPEATLSEHISRFLTQPESSELLSSPQHEELSVITSLLNHALAERNNQSDIDRLLKKLEKPIYDIALRGEAPPQLETHPLGCLINLVDQFAIVADDDGFFQDTQLKELVESVIDKGIAQQGDNPDSLNATATALEKLLKYPTQIRKQRVNGYQELCEARIRVQESGKEVVNELNRRLAGRVIPRIVIDLLEFGWRHQLVLLGMRDNREEWDRAWRILNELIDASEQTPSGDSETVDFTLLNEIESHLATLSLDSHQLEELMKELGDYLRGPGQAERVKLPEGWFTPTDQPSDSTQPPDESIRKRLRVGDWWSLEHDGGLTPMQLIWLSHPPSRACFVNRSADSKLEVTLNELASLIGRGKAQPAENYDLPLLERSEYGVIDAMYRQLVRQAYQDPITGLPNRKSLIHQVERDARLNEVNSFCILDFEPYRLIFDDCGIEAGEALIRELADLVKRNLGTKDILAVTSEGSFAVFLPAMSSDTARDYVARLGHSLEGFRFRHGEKNFGIQTFFGLANHQPGTIEAAEALRRAASACELAHSIGPNSIQLYTDSDDRIKELEVQHQWAGQIDEMLSGGHLYLRCQKIAPLGENGVLPYYEILLGLADENDEQISPQSFVLAVERWQRAGELDLWVINTVIDWIRRNRDDFDRTGGFSVNLSAQSLSNHGILSTLNRELSSGDLPCEKIVFEITETATLQSHSVAQDFMRQIRRYGCRFSLDDFGSGNASFGYLRSLRTDALKIDGAYIQDMVGNPELQAMVRSMNEIGHALGMKTVAEFVANTEILAMVKEIGVDYVQGYEIGKPIRLDDLVGHLSSDSETVTDGEEFAMSPEVSSLH